MSRLNKSIDFTLIEKRSVLSTQPPRRRRRSKRSAEEEVAPPRRRKKTSGGSGRKQAVNDTIIMKSIAGVAVCFAVIYVVFIFDWSEVSVALGGDRSLEKLRDDLKYYQQKQLNLIASFETKEQADAAAPQLNELAKKLEEISVEYDYWNDLTDADEIWARQNRAPEVAAAEAVKSMEISRLILRHPQLLMRAASRPRDTTRLGAHIGALVRKAKQAADKYGHELRLEKAKEGAFKEGYTPVTAYTHLTEGMHLQAIGVHNSWDDCIIRKVNQDGTVRVDYENSFLDRIVERDCLRIPDNPRVVQRRENLSPVPRSTFPHSGRAVRQPQNTQQPGIANPPVKPPSSNRSF